MNIEAFQNVLNNYRSGQNTNQMRQDAFMNEMRNRIFTAPTAPDLEELRLRYRNKNSPGEMMAGNFGFAPGMSALSPATGGFTSVPNQDPFANQMRQDAFINEMRNRVFNETAPTAPNLEELRLRNKNFPGGMMPGTPGNLLGMQIYG